MTGAMRRSTLVVLVLAVCAGPWGCAIKQPRAPQSPTEDVRAQLNTVGLPVAESAPETHVDAPTGGKGMGALKGAGIGLAAGATPGLAIAGSVGRGCGAAREIGAVVCGAVIVLGLGVAAAGGTIGALGGTLYGAVTAESASKIDAAEAELKSAVIRADVQTTLRDHVLLFVRDRSSLNVVAMNRGAAGERIDDQALASSGIDTVLEVSVARIGLAGQSGINPPVSLFMSARARLVRTAQEPVYRTLMRLYVQQDRRGAALRLYETCVRVLERELGLEPEAETRALYRELLQAPTRSAPPASERAPTPSVSEPETALFGRATEMAMLRERLAEAWKSRGAIGIIQGEAGIGKTRLIDALVREASDEGGHVLVGRGYESEQVLPLGPWVNAFRPDVVPDLLNNLDPTWRTELGRLFPELAAGDRPPAAGEDYVRLFEAVTRTVQYVASQRPLLVVLEDLHWADEMTLRLLVFLGRRIGDSPVLIVGTVRTEETADAPVHRRTLSQLGHQPRFFSATLGPLSQAETLTFVQALARAGTDDDTVQRLGDHVWRASEGNAFMIVETMRMLHGGEIDTTASDLLTPPGVRELITSRLDRLSERGRRLTGVGSVIGREFDFALLERAAELGPAETAEGLEELVARRIFHVVGERLDFTHERIREVAYAGLLAPSRKRLHEATAQALEALYGPDAASHALSLGRHYYASERWEAAHRYLAKAGKTAAARSANREAAACFEQAIDALRHLPRSSERVEQIIDLCFDIRQSCVPLLDHARALAYLRVAEEQADAIGDRTRLGWAYTYRAHGLYIAGDSRGAIEAGEQSLALAEALADPDLLESANVYRAQVAHWVGDYRHAAELLRRNVTTLEPDLRRRGLPSWQFVGSRTYLSWCLAELGEFSEALARTDEAIATATAADNVYWLVYACSGAGLVHLRRGAFDEARAVSERAVALCSGRDFTVLWAMPAAILGLACARAGRFAEAIPLLERAADLASILGVPILTFLAEARLLAGRDDEAAAVATRARELAAQREERGWEAWAWWMLGEIAATRADVSSAGDAYRQALTAADALAMRPLVAQCHLGLGRLHRRSGKQAQAVEHLGAARTMFRDMSMSWWLGEAERESVTPL